MILLAKVQKKYNDFKEFMFVFLWRIRLEIEYRLWLITRNVEGAF